MDKSLKIKIIDLYNQGYTYQKIKTELNCSKGTISYHLFSFVQEKKELKNDWLLKIEKELPQNREEFISLHGDNLTTREINYFLKNYYSIPSKGTKRGNVPKEYYSKKRRELKTLLINYKGGKCEKCDYNKCIGALEFHHTDPKKKEFAISNCGLKKIDRLKEEVDKCNLLCANCHRELHYNNKS